MAQPRIASRTPTACAACYQQKPDVPHIDFAAALEGRLIDPSHPRGGHVDWVIICADCLRNGYELLPEQSSQREALERKVEQLEQRAADAENYASSLEDTLSRRPTPKPAPKAAADRPKAPRQTKQRRNRYEAKA